MYCRIEILVSPEKIISCLMQRDRMSSVDGSGPQRVKHVNGIFHVFLSLQVFDDCQDGGEISPSNCIYMTEWLDF